MPWLFFYASLSIPLFYGVGMLFGPKSHFAVIDFWRFWVVHLWVEDFLEIFTTVTVAYMFVLIGMVPERTATRLIYLEIILYSIGGVVGSMHHLYFSGAPAVHMALGAFFSAMEVVPLVLLTFEAWRFMRLGGAKPGETVMDTSDERFPAQVGGDVPRGRRLLELRRRRRLRVSDQPPRRELLGDRHPVHGEPRSRGDDGRLRNAGRSASSSSWRRTSSRATRGPNGR